jgi:prepilin-type N-terminal cleavage/methylation domain-containing protein
MGGSGYRQGMTLIEILLAVTIIGLLAALMVPAFNRASRSRHNAQTAGRLRMLVSAFELYASENGDYPADVNRGVVPAGMQPYFDSLGIDWFSQTTALGGNWDWGKNQLGALATIAIAAPTASQAQMEEFDRLLDDDGNLDTGRFRKSGVHHYYIIRP